MVQVSGQKLTKKDVLRVSFVTALHCQYRAPVFWIFRSQRNQQPQKETRPIGAASDLSFHSTERLCYSSRPHQIAYVLVTNPFARQQAARSACRELSPRSVHVAHDEPKPI
uniref:Uncharacterized protein n=1 Tax=Ralstonia syzygii R24 TaxID=907261 RepID=G3A1K7_9RALS|nr:hypothetical protein RALSY_11102 [Ralstonia syzygii R24]